MSIAATHRLVVLATAVVLTNQARHVEAADAAVERSGQPASQQATTAGTKVRPAEQRLITAVNQYRARYKLPPLKPDPVLMRVARQRAPYLDSRRSAGCRGYNHHACGQWCREHARAAGFAGPATDNLAMGYETPEDAVEGWAREDHDRHPVGHNYQMRGLAQINGRWVDERHNRIGVGIVGRNYIAIFGRRPTKLQ